MNVFSTPVIKNTSLGLVRPGDFRFETAALHLSLSQSVFLRSHVSKSPQTPDICRDPPSLFPEHALLLFRVTAIVGMTLKQPFEKFKI